MGTAFLAALLVLVLLLVVVKGKIEQKGCDIFRGEWVFDHSYPLYDPRQCPFLEEEFDCEKNGRPDRNYTKFKWKPTGCTLPRFNGVYFLNKVKGKKIIFVGDSLSLNQWQSLTCLIHTAVPQAKYISDEIGLLSTFTFPDFDVSIDYLRNAFLVDIVNEARGRVLRLDSLSTTRVWGDKDIMIFDSWHWWLHTGPKQPWDWVVFGNTTIKDLDRMVAYEKALDTWAKWIDSNVDPTKTQVFFQGVSPDHSRGQDLNCKGRKRPRRKPGRPHPAELVLEKVLRSMAKPVYLLNITAVSQVRVDGHPCQYGNRRRTTLDCTHWCLSGVPDIWNEFLSAMLS